MLSRRCVAFLVLCALALTSCSDDDVTPMDTDGDGDAMPPMLCAATGINGDQTDNSATWAGALYVRRIDL